MLNLLITLTLTSALISASDSIMDSWYMIPPLGITTVLDLQNRSSLLTLPHQPAADR